MSWFRRPKNMMPLMQLDVNNIEQAKVFGDQIRALRLAYVWLGYSKKERKDLRDQFPTLGAELDKCARDTGMAREQGVTLL